jgi:hypothetical protein
MELSAAPSTAALRTCLLATASSNCLAVIPGVTIQDSYLSITASASICHLVGMAEKVHWPDYQEVAQR